MNLWYRDQLDPNIDTRSLWGVLTPALQMSASVYLNGELLGTAAALTTRLRVTGCPLCYSA